jgi:predicted nucleic acid-binding protein
MIILDTNIISEMMKAESDASVSSWFKAQNNESLYTTVISQAEIGYGIAALPEGKRKTALINASALMFNTVFDKKILPFCSLSASHYPQIVLSRKQSGNDITVMDAELAAICLANNAVLATRNTKDFTGLGITVINPWDA